MIDKSDIPGAGFVGSLIAVIGDIILFSGDVIIATLGALLSSVELLGSMLSIMGQLIEDLGASAGVADQLVLIGSALLLGGLGWRALRIVGRDVSRRIRS